MKNGASNFGGGKTGPLSPTDLYSLEEYSKLRTEFRKTSMQHKRLRKVHVGPHVTLLFEDRLTMQYQVQEVLRVERIFEEKEIEEELGAYNPLIPTGQNLKATMLIEYEDEEERRRALNRLTDIEDRVWVRIADGDQVYAIADEDMERERGEKTSSVHFLRFEFSTDACTAAKAGASIAVGVDHDNYRYANDPVDDKIRAALVRDFA